jgi:hypothetical protein
MTTHRMTLLVADPARFDHARAIRGILADVAPYCSVEMHFFDLLHRVDEDSPAFARGVAASLGSDVVLLLAPTPDARTNAALIALRERAGFTERFHEPQFARIWLTPDHQRSLYILGTLPGAYIVLSLALEFGFSDPDGAKRLLDHGLTVWQPDSERADTQRADPYPRRESKRRTLHASW